MATTSTIAIEYNDGAVEQISCHWDGYPEHNGKLLMSYWSDSIKLADLMQLGNLSELGQKIGQKQDFDSPNQEWCLAYGRDRGEDDTQAVKYSTLDEYKSSCQIEDYNYIFLKDQWFVFQRNMKMRPLKDVLEVLAVEALK